MKLEEAKIIIENVANKPLGTLINNETEFSDIVTNKGKTGQLLEKVILCQKLSSALHDFEDGELKTNKCKSDGTPEETIAITQISTDIDNLIQNIPFETSRLAQKIKNILYVGIVKEGDAHNWQFLSPIHIDFSQEKFQNIWHQLTEDYNNICKKIKQDIETNGEISTSNGCYIQIRTKDSTPYHPIFSNIYNKYVSNKNYAFYFKKNFIKDIMKIN